MPPSTMARWRNQVWITGGQPVNIVFEQTMLNNPWAQRKK
jgi:hypothetical protein